jgi:Flp pilus assembly pilin Flp
MLREISRLAAEDGGQDLAEYGIALAVISILAGLAAVVISKDVGTLWSQAQSVIQSASSSATS